MADPPRASCDASLRAGQDALRRGEWEKAQTDFEATLARLHDCAEAWEGLGLACYWLQDARRMFEARQEAYRLYQARGDGRSAARLATWLASDFLEFRGEPAVASGWLERAAQLLAEVERSLEHAFVREIEAHVALAVHHDPAAARHAAREALEIALELGDTDHEMWARAIEGLALVAHGDVGDGMRRLDGAAAAALGGDMADLTAISVTCCYVIQACVRVRDYRRATEWCGRFHDFCTRWRLGTFLTFCRIQYGTVLLWRGEWEQAERELLAAREQLESVRPAARTAALVRLGELRRRQGRWTEAAELLEEARTHPLAALSRGALELDQGDAVSAEELADLVLRRTAGGADAERLAALELLARARAARGAHAQAAEAVAELETVAARVGTAPARAGALFAAGVAARLRGNYTDSRRCLADAADLYEAGGSPFEAGQARLELADALAAIGRGKPAEAEAKGALAVFEYLGADREAARARERLAALRLSPSREAAPDPHAVLTGRQREVLRLVAQGLSNRRIAEQLVLSEFTIRRHLSNIYARLGVSTRTAAVARALADGLL